MKLYRVTVISGSFDNGYLAWLVGAQTEDQARSLLLADLEGSGGDAGLARKILQKTRSGMVRVELVPVLWLVPIATGVLEVS